MALSTPENIVNRSIGGGFGMSYSCFWGIGARTFVAAEDYLTGSCCSYLAIKADAAKLSSQSFAYNNSINKSTSSVFSITRRFSIARDIYSSDLSSDDVSIYLSI